MNSYLDFDLGLILFIRIYLDLLLIIIIMSNLTIHLTKSHPCINSDF